MAMSEQSLSTTAALLPADMAKVVPLQAEVINLPARGDVNYVRGGVVHGWAWDPQASDQPLRVTLVHGDDVVAEDVAHHFREDLKKAGVGTGKHAFRLRIPSHFYDGGVHKFSVKFENGVLLKRGELEFGPHFVDAKAKPKRQPVQVVIEHKIAEEPPKVEDVGAQWQRVAQDFDKQIKLIKSTKQVHRNWYLETYPDVAALGMEPAVHYLRYGAAMGRNPGKSFNTKFYLSEYPDAAASGLNPLVHYALFGQENGYITRHPGTAISSKRLMLLRTKLLSLGFTEQPLKDLQFVAKDSTSSELRSQASRELALWNMRSKSDEGYRAALGYLQAAREDSPDLNFCRYLATTEVLCHYFLGDLDAARVCYKRAVLAGELSPDLLLAGANLEATPEARIALMNRALAHYNIPPITLLDDPLLPAYDRLTSAVPLQKVVDGPKVTVLIAAYDAADTLPTALRSLQEQTWQNLEILVLDDCSPTDGTVRVAQAFADRDPRIKVVPMERNGGAYIARNRGLDMATGDYVTLHDADDWSHQLKIETQVRFMEANPDVMGCLTQQARAMSDLSFTRWTGSGWFIITNTSSFMFRRAPIKQKLGYWDTVRFGADMELIRRITAVWGKGAVHKIDGTLFSFQRDSNTSIVADEALGASTLPFGVRRQYVETQLVKHGDTQALLYDNDPERRPFPVPKSMLLSKPASAAVKHYDVIIASDFRMIGGSVNSSSQEIACQKRAGLKTAILPMFRYDFDRLDRPVLPEVWDQVDGEAVDVIAYGQKVSCDLLIIRYPPVLYHRQKFVPEVSAKDIRIIVNQPPMSDYGEDGIVRYELEKCAENIRHYFGKDATWHPIGPLVRSALHDHHAEELQHINLSDQDWTNIIDIDGWDRGVHDYDPKGRLRIGRHSRDHAHKWPEAPEEMLAAYPAAKDVEVHVLGGGETPTAILGKLPKNWTIYEFGSVHPKDFLKEIDVWIYFANPHWVESFGRTIIEAMAVGVPVILPDVYQPLFKDAALYATPETAVAMARELYADPAAYQAQVEKAKTYVRNNFSFEMHVDRVQSLKATQPAIVAANDQADVEDLDDEMVKMIAIPAQSGKTSGEILSDLPRYKLDANGLPPSLDSALWEANVDGYRFDYLWAPKPGAKRLFVLFSGDAQRSKNPPPVFQRWTWASHFPGHCLYVSDPMLHVHSEVSLAWYAGTDKLDPVEVIIRQIETLLPKLGLKVEDVCTYGSSGGGFAALRTAAKMPGISAITINPQTDIVRYERKSPDKFARLCLKRPDRDAAMADFPLRMSLMNHVDALRGRPIIYIQNELDTHHYEEHFKPFCKAMGADPKENLESGLFRRILFSHEGGHTKAETPEVFSVALDILQGDSW